MGRGQQVQRCTDLIAELGVPGRVFLCGQTRHVGYCLRKADLVMHLAGHNLSGSDDASEAEIQSALEVMLQDLTHLGGMGQTALSHGRQRGLPDQIPGRSVTLFLERT